MMQGKISFISFIFFLFINTVSAQNVIYGVITDENDEPFSNVNISIVNTSTGTYSENDGSYELKVGDKKTVKIQYSFVGYKSQTELITFFKDKRLRKDVTLKLSGKTFDDIIITGDKNIKHNQLTHLDALQVEKLPSVTGGIEALLKTLPGVSANNELSSQYSVRGGNFDENLIYVNDFQVYRPFLVRSGQQEGLSFVNSDLVKSIAFSAGGFEAKYGDKLSSVLDIKYKKPKKQAGSISASLLGVNAHLEGRGKNKNLTYILGIRQRSNSYLLNSLSAKGNYNPLFIDFQSFFTYNLNTNWQLQFISNYSKNRYQFQPEEQIERIGSIVSTKQIRTAFVGQEKDTYDSFMGGIGGVYTSDNQKMTLKYLASMYNTKEIESFDIIGEYFIGEVESDLGQEEFGNVVRESGIGTYHDYARNKLEANISNIAHKGYLEKDKHYINWGVKYQFEDIKDKINEWQRVDSAGYSISSDFGVRSSGYNDSIVELFSVLKSSFNLKSHRFSGFLQDTYSLGQNDNMSLTGGLRFNYWNVNDEFFLSPRFQFAWKPTLKDNEKNADRDLTLRASSGLYYQSPFYREMRNFEGFVNTNLKSQKSWHLIGGLDYEFSWTDRPFKFTAEAYYKRMWDLVPYDLDNVLIRYYGENAAKGYATGLDMRINGEFVNGTQSWFSLSFLNTKELLENDEYTVYFNKDDEETLPGRDSIAYQVVENLGYVRRPTNQTVNFSIFFQDNLPKNENIKGNLNFVFGTPLPFGPADQIRNRNAFNTPIYFRVDIGFSALLFENGKKEIPETSLMNKFQSIWLALEVFNIIDRQNTVSYNWINDFNGVYYPVPNRLTSRRLNARLIVKF